MAVQGPSNQVIQDNSKGSSSSLLSGAKGSPKEPIDIYEYILRQLHPEKSSELDEILLTLEEEEPIVPEEEMEYNEDSEDDLSEVLNDISLEKQRLNLEIEKNKTERVSLLAQILSALR